MPLQECINGHTYREYLTWMAWLDEEEWEHPNPTQYYLMQIAQEVCRVISKKPEKIKLEHFKMQFSRAVQPPPKPKAVKDRMTEYTKLKWKMAVGLIKPKE